MFALTGWVDMLDTLVSVGRRGRAGPVEEGGPSERYALRERANRLSRSSTAPLELLVEWIALARL